MRAQVDYWSAGATCPMSERSSCRRWAFEAGKSHPGRHSGSARPTEKLIEREATEKIA